MSKKEIKDKFESLVNASMNSIEESVKEAKEKI